MTKNAEIVNIPIMALFDIFRKSKEKDDRLKRPPKGALKKPKKAEMISSAVQKKNVKSEEKKVSAEFSADAKPLADKSSSKKAVAGKTKISDLASVVFLAPHITEKTAVMAESNNVYAFRVGPSVNKIIAGRAFRELYGFNPIKVRILNMPSKERIVRGRVGVKSGYKKALIYLKKGDKIELS